jgi:DNA-binding protein H-NS
MSIDLNTLSPKELDALISKAKKRQSTLKKRKPLATVRARLRAAAAAEGYSIAKPFGGTAAKSAGAAAPRKAPTKAGKAGRKLGKVAPKYRNPENGSETWTGRGKQPRWMAERVAQGKTPEDFLIAK